MNLERFAEGIEQYEDLRRRGTSNPTSYENLQEMLIQTGDLKRAREVADEYTRKYPDSVVALRMQGEMLVLEGRLDEARASYEKAEIVDPLDFVSRLGTRTVAVLQERWADLRAANQAMSSAPNPFVRFLDLWRRCSRRGCRT